MPISPLKRHRLQTIQFGIRTAYSMLVVISLLRSPLVASAGSQLTRSGSRQRRLTAMPKWMNTARCHSGLFLDVFGLNAGTKDGRFAVDFWADNVGYDNQHYDLSIYEPGRQYFNIGWDQTPHLLSTSAKSIFGGVGSTSLTVDPATRTFLQSQSVVATQTQANRNNIDQFIGGAPPFGGAGFPAPDNQH